MVHLCYLPYRCGYCPDQPIPHYSATSAEAEQHQSSCHPEVPPRFVTEVDVTLRAQLKEIMTLSLKASRPPESTPLQPLGQEANWRQPWVIIYDFYFSKISFLAEGCRGGG